MIHINKDGIEHDGSKQQLMVDFINLVYTFKDIAKLDNKEIERLEKCFGLMLRQEDVKQLINEFNLEQREDIINQLYLDIGIKKIGYLNES